MGDDQEKQASEDEVSNPPNRSWKKLVLMIIAAILLLIGLVFFLFFIIVKPRKMDVSVTKASLTEFNLLSNSSGTVNFNVDLEFTIRNPNRLMGFYYKHFGIWVYYEDHFVDYGSFGEFYQGYKDTVVKRLSFKGNQMLHLDDNYSDVLVSKFEREKSDEVFSFDLKFEVRVKVKLGRIRIGTFVPKLRCPLEVPLTTNDEAKSAANAFKTTKCDVKFKAISIFDVPFKKCLSCY
ncbi:hypothetical protein UlMin_005420 [Ulmus minor]